MTTNSTLRDSIFASLANVGVSTETTGLAKEAQVIEEAKATEKVASADTIDAVLADIDGFLKEASGDGLAEPLGGEASTAVDSDKGESQSAANASGEGDARTHADAPLATDQAAGPDEAADDLGGSAPFKDNDEGESENSAHSEPAGDTESRTMSVEGDKLATVSEAARAIETGILEDHLAQKIATEATEKLASARMELQANLGANIEKTASACVFNSILFL